MLCAVMASFLPETLGTDMPQCLEDTRDFLHDQPYFSFITRRKLRAAAGDTSASGGLRRRSTVVSQDGLNGAVCTKLARLEAESSI